MYIIRYGGQNNKALLKIFKLFRIIPKKKYSLIFFKIGGGGGRPLPVLVMVHHYMDHLSMAHVMSCKISLQTGLKENFFHHLPLALYKKLALIAELHINQPKPIAKCGGPSRGARTTSVDAVRFVVMFLKKIKK